MDGGGSVLGLLGLLAAAAAAIYTALQFTEQSKSNRLGTFNAVRTRIEDLSVQVTSVSFRDVQQEVNRTGSRVGSDPVVTERDVVLERLFNEIEWLALLVNRDLVPREIAEDHYRDGFERWWQIFEDNALDSAKLDPRQYKNFRALAQEFRSRPRYSLTPIATAVAARPTCYGPGGTAEPITPSTGLFLNAQA